ncbi:unnamed protein product [Rhodiola kirilowii]
MGNGDVQGEGENNEPDPDDSENLKNSSEPDLDDTDILKKISEPDPDDSENLKNVSEPDTDDSGNKYKVDTTDSPDECDEVTTKEIPAGKSVKEETDVQHTETTVPDEVSTVSCNIEVKPATYNCDILINVFYYTGFR